MMIHDTMARLISIRNGFVCFRDGNDDTDTSDVVKKLDWICEDVGCEGRGGR